ncbi:hypothetical protein [Metabacillus indicus]|uniref:hypothetical protein n=1 Tax=Metabacillus indicus TaxID=246786 RepID=UPI0024929D29|nr:hypothetical protein [Metabacillus indicus]
MNKKHENPENIKKELYDYEKIHKATVKIGKRGWTIPFSFSIEQISFFEQELHTDIDTIFMWYFSEEENFDRMINAILSINEIKQWHEAIKQCVYAHKNKMFILSISTLIPILEGILSAFEKNKNNTKMMKVCKEMIESPDFPSIFDKIIWTSCYHFISTLYQKSDFSGTEPEIVNRHWILHGRTAFNNSEVDSIKIFNAIETVSKIKEYHNKKSEVIRVRKEVPRLL